MRQSFRLIVQLSNHICTVQADKFTTSFSVDFVILNDNPDLLDKTGIKLAIFKYETFDKDYLNPSISYRHRRPDLQLPNLPFENIITESIRRHEGVCKPIPKAKPVEKSTIL